jgi:hypothetical protein
VALRKTESEMSKKKDNKVKNIPTGIPKDSVEQEQVLKVFEEDAVHLSGNVVISRLDGEELLLGFGNRRFNRPNEVDIHSFMHLSVPHFIRMFFMLSNNLNKMKEQGVIDVEMVDSNQEGLTLKLEDEQ